MRQHIIPRCYLKAWCDPHAQSKETPFVWIFETDQRLGRKKAPINIFHQTDIYTLISGEGDQDLKVEKSLSEIEYMFTTVRNSKLNYGKALTREEHFLLCVFMSCMHARTPQQLDHLKAQWGGLLRTGEEMMAQFASTTPKRRKEMASIPRLRSEAGEKSMSLSDLRKLVDNPVESFLLPLVRVQAPLFFKLDFCILRTESEKGFITSDLPCVLSDSEAYKRPPLYRAPMLGSKTTEIYFPVSPSLCLLLNRAGLKGYQNVPDEVVSDINRKIRFASDKHFISNRNYTEDVWFDPGVEPEDSWDNRHKKD